MKKAISLIMILMLLSDYIVFQTLAQNQTSDRISRKALDPKYRNSRTNSKKADKALSSLAWSWKSKARKQEKSQKYATWEIIVKFKSWNLDLKKSDWEKKLQKFSSWGKFSVLWKFKNSNSSLLKTSSWETIESAISRIKTDPNVEYAEPNYIYSIETINSNDTYKDKLWWLDNIGQTVWWDYSVHSWNNDNDMDAPEAWWIDEWTWAQIIVAVIDTWVAFNHPDLLANMWDWSNCKNENWIPVSWWCPNHWWSYTSISWNNNPLPTDSSHGTHVAWTIAAAKNNSNWIIWVAPNAKIMALKTDLSSTSIVKSIDFATQNWAKVINASFWWNWYSTAQYEAIRRFKDAGWIFVAAAGNWGSDWISDNNETTHHYPSDYNLDNIISVAATDQKDALASFSNYWSVSIDVWAPWTNIYSTVGNSLIADENFTSVQFGSMPSGWTRTGLWWAFNFYWLTTVLKSNYNSTYWDSEQSQAVSPTYNLTNTSWNATLSFLAWCDTEYDPDNYTDFMYLEMSKDWWSTYTELDLGFGWSALDEFMIDLLNSWEMIKSNWYSLYYFEDVSIPAAYQNSNFKLRLNWISDEKANWFGWCFIDNLEMNKMWDWTENKYAYYDWTSMAAPHVSGLAALAFWYSPASPYSEIRNLILSNWDSVPSLSGKTVTWKRVNAFKTLSALNKINLNDFSIYRDQSKASTIQSESWMTGSVSPYLEWTTDSTATPSRYDIRIDHMTGYSVSAPNPSDVSWPKWNHFSWSTVSNYMTWLIFDSNWEYSLYARAITLWGKIWDWSNAKIRIDNAWPEKIVSSAPSDWWYLQSSSTGTVALSWEAPIDEWIWMQTWKYKYLLSADPDMQTISYSWTTALTLANMNSIPDWKYYFTIQGFDSLGNTWAISDIKSFIKDIDPPSPPTNVVLNNWSVINQSNQKNLTLLWSWSLSDIGAQINYSISKSWKNVSWTWILDEAWNFRITNIDVSSLDDWNLEIIVTLSDKSGNLSVQGNFQAIKAATPPIWSISFNSWAYINSTGTIIRINSSKEAEYIISWTGVAATLTWNISWNTDIPITLTSWDWIKEISLQLIDSNWNMSSAYSASTTIDTVIPQININSYSDGFQMTGNIIDLSGSTTDNKGIKHTKINWQIVGSIQSWNLLLPLAWWENIFEIEASDLAGNIATKTMRIYRIPDKANAYSNIISIGSVKITFDTDIASIWTVEYSADLQNLNESLSDTESDKHSITLTNLTPDTNYYFRVFWTAGWLKWKVSDIYNFKTPKLLDIAWTQGSSYFWAVYLSWSSATWAALTINNPLEIFSQNNSWSIIFKWWILNINATSGNWDWIITPPSLTLSNWTLNMPWYSQLNNLTYKIWSENSPLNFSWATITVRLPIWIGKEWKTLKIYRSDDNQTTFSFVSDCLVTAWMCVFETDSFSVFSPVEPADDIPDQFEFNFQWDVALSTLMTSNTIIIAWMNLSAHATLVWWWTLFINWTDSGSGWTVRNWDSINIKLLSSPDYQTSTQWTLQIWKVSSSFRVTTIKMPYVAPPQANSWGGGGWWWGWEVISPTDNCPFWDKSWNPNDSKCDIALIANPDICASGDKSWNFYDWKCDAPVRIANSALNSAPAYSVNSNNKKNTPKDKFSDIGDSFAKDDINKLVSSWIIKWYEDKTFRPNNTATRGEFLAITMKALGVNTAGTADTDYDDITPDWKWIIPYLEKAKEFWINGQQSNWKHIFRQNDPITRAEALAMLLSIAKIKRDAGTSTQFTDVSVDWMIPYIAKAKKLSIVSGQTIDWKLKFRPNDTITRAETVKIIIKAQAVK
ncbi:MAG: Cna protein B-type protein [uncultured bacterium (gcode 4)]|uniref:Cna protein B-type protein n=1 Tax=uncultured bacterium (gcode 4) TaxID=1234023 RepID=K2G4M3_9BACT|nr:MAG: Cna protein B-type protein [uncultured bacterium (gcode 4)]